MITHASQLSVRPVARWIPFRLDAAMTAGATAMVAFAVTLAACPVVLRAIRHRVVDEPNSRSLHKRSTPRGGGLAVALGAVVAASASTGWTSWRAPLLIAGLGFGLLGLLDDLWHLPVLSRLVIQMLVAGFVLPLLLHGITGPAAWKAAFALGVLLWMVSYVNAFNFMDGINGISVVQALVAGLAWGSLGLIEDVPALATGGLVIVGCAVGFAPFNVPDARMFLGDVGSYFIGGWLAVLAVIGLRSGLPPEAMLAPVAVALADTLSTILRRLRRGERLHQAHSDHTYQRLVHAGWSHTATTAFVGTVAAVAGVLGATTVPLAGSWMRCLADLAILVVLCGYLCSPSLPGRAIRGRSPVQ